MIQVPDAPWIREAEMYGMPPYDDEEPVCPCCSNNCERLFVVNRDVLGCENCVEEKDAWDWMFDHKEEG